MHQLNTKELQSDGTKFSSISYLFKTSYSRSSNLTNMGWSQIFTLCEKAEMIKTVELEFKAYVESIAYIQIRTLGETWESQDS